MSSTDDRRLFKPIRLGDVMLNNRVAMAPLTRYRAPDHVPVERHAIYYGQRATAGLLITEATFISPEAGGYLHVPGIWSKQQIAGWKLTTQAVHEKGGHIYLQLWAIGRANSGKQDVKRVVSASNLAYPGGATPEPLTKDEIKEYVSTYRQAAINAIAAGFDGVEIHNANGYLLNQFLESVSNIRTDEYGGSLDNRTRFSREVIKAVTDAIGEERTGIRLSPFGKFQGMGFEADPYEVYTHLLKHIRQEYPRFSYIHIVEDTGAWLGKEIPEPRSVDPFRRMFHNVTGKDSENVETFAEPGQGDSSPTVFISCGDYKTESSIRTSEAKGDVIAIGRSYISNPDLVERIRRDLPWTKYDRDTFYTPLRNEGYLDYAVYGERGHGEIVAEQKAQAQAQQARM